MIDKGKHNLLGILIDALDYEAAVEKVIRAAKDRKALTVAALPVHGVMSGVLDPRLRYVFNHLDLIAPDGQPVRWALNWMYRTGLGDRVYGPTLMLEICKRAADESLPVFLYGSNPEVIAPLSRKLGARFPDLVIAGARPGRYRRLSGEEKKQVVTDIRASGAAMVFTGLGCPRQEQWIYEYRDSLSMPLIAVGAAFDFHAGRVPQAPPLMQRWGLEWLFRLTMEPRRLWRRYLYYNPMYLLLLSLQASGLVEFDPERYIPPTRESMFG